APGAAARRAVHAPADDDDRHRLQVHDRAERQVHVAEARRDQGRERALGPARLGLDQRHLRQQPPHRSPRAGGQRLHQVRQRDAEVQELVTEAMTMLNTRWWMTVAVICCVGLASARTARADGLTDVEVQYTVKPPDPANPKTKGDAPSIEVTVIGAQNLTADKFMLIDKTVKPTVEMKAASKRGFLQGTETLAVAIV